MYGICLDQLHVRPIATVELAGFRLGLLIERVPRMNAGCRSTPHHTCVRAIVRAAGNACV
jgi:hypothetical protein